MARLHRLAMLACALVALCLLPAVARAAGCGPRGYAWAGLQVPQAHHGIAAMLTAVAPPVVERGHVAGWVGVGGPDQGPNGTAEWLQVGLNSTGGGPRNDLYYEVGRPSGAVQYVAVGSVPAGRQLRVAVLETASHAGVWRVWVDGRAVSPPIPLPGSHLSLTPMAMTESWDGGAPACNRYAYRFRRVLIADAPGGGWRAVERAFVRQDRGFRVVRRTESNFLAASRRPARRPDTGQSRSASAPIERRRVRTESRR